MKKSSIIGGAVALALSVTASTAMAAGNNPFGEGKQAPNLSVQEKVLFTLNETTVSIVSAIVDAIDCSVAEGSYTYSATAFANGTGTATIDDYTINATVISEMINPNGIRGTRVDVDDDGEEEIGDVQLRNLDGTFYFSRKGEIMYSNADFQIFPGGLGSHWEDYDEHVIKDYYWYPARNQCNGVLSESCTFDGVFNSGRGGVKDAGLEVITKLDYPRAKWREMSQYLPPNGVIGKSTITKTSIAPENAPECKVEIHEAQVIDFGSGLQLDGKVDVEFLGF